MKVKEESKKADLKFNIQKHKIMASGTITFMGNRWGNETVTDFIFLGFLGLMLLNCGPGEDSWESLGLQEDQTSQS